VGLTLRPGTPYCFTAHIIKVLGAALIGRDYPSQIQGIIYKTYSQIHDFLVRKDRARCWVTCVIPTILPLGHLGNNNYPHALGNAPTIVSRRIN
jgi:hypothetical protein